jgi:hypothetical protein
VRVGCLDERGIAPTERVDPSATEAALDLALGIVDALDAELAARDSGRAAAVR